jgi:hypothetical protein
VDSGDHIQTTPIGSDERIDAVLPLILRDLERAEQLLIPSMTAYLDVLGVCRVVVPDDEIPEFSRRISNPRIQIIGEHEVIPELRWFRRTVDEGEGTGKGLRGWFVQQLIKLSIARFVQTPFYLTLDADVLCCRSISYDDLIVEGRSLTFIQENGEKGNDRWYERSAQLLELPRSERSHGVTPALLSTAGVMELLEFFAERLRPNHLRPEALLLANVPWTEYSLYYTFLEQTGRFDQFHIPTKVRTSANNVWGGGNPESWDPAASFGPNGPLFSVLQSHTVKNVEQVVLKTRTYFASSGRQSPV